MYCIPGELFLLAMEAKRRGMRVVGSTQNILDFITQHIQETVSHDGCLQFVLGTESSMVTTIVSAIRNVMTAGKSNGARENVEGEIIFPVSSDSISKTSSSGDLKLDERKNFTSLFIIPGVSFGEGYSIHGRCASCPYMKTNTLDSLLKVCNLVDIKKRVLLLFYQAQRFDTSLLLGHSIADVRCELILYMRYFQSTEKLPENLVHQILNEIGE